MSRYERYGTRDLTYSGWHRQACPDRVQMIDIDAVEFCRRCRMPLMLIETAIDTGQNRKTTTVTERLAGAANIPAFCVLYTVSAKSCVTDNKGACTRVGCDHGISAFRWRRVQPNPHDEWQSASPAEWAKYLTDFHDMHESMVCAVVLTGGTR